MSRITSVEDFFHQALHDAELIGEFIAKHQVQINSATDTAVAVISAVDPAIAPIATLIPGLEREVLSQIAAAVHMTGAATSGKGMTVTYDPQFVAEVSTLITLMEKMQPGSTKPPTGLARSVQATAL